MARREERIVVLAPSAHDGPVTVRILSRSGFDCALVHGVCELCAEIDAGAAAVVIAEEALARPAAAEPFLELLQRQESWSDLPVILFMRPQQGDGGDAPARNPTVASLAPLGNVTVLARPAPSIALVSAVGAALRARRRQYAARAVVQELQAVLDCIADGVIVYDREGRTLRSTRAADEILSIPAAARGAPVQERVAAQYEILSEDGRRLGPEEMVAVRAAVHGEEVKGAILRVQARGGDPRWLMVNGMPLRISGEHRGAVISVTDITDRKRAEDAVREADRRKTDFLAVLSHELRNPLAPIRNSIQIIERAPPGSEAAARALRVLRRQSDHLARLVDDLLDITRITHGKIELQLVRLDARDVVRRAWEDARALFDEREVDLVLAQAHEPLWVDADAARLGQMVGNLLHNALKFTPPGGRVRVGVDRRGAACEVSVTDTGVGIDAGDLDRIFDPFVQVGQTRRGHGGMGIGLALVRDLATRMGGRVRAGSGGLGRGAEFAIQLPLAAPPAAHAVEAAGEPHGARLSVLIVEDNVDAAASLRDLLALSGHRVATVATGREGLEAVTEQAPDVLISDVGLPDMSGHDLIRAVRSAASGRRVFAIALTGYAQPEDRQAALEAGFDAHLGKPPALDELEALLGDAARRSG